MNYSGDLTHGICPKCVSEMRASILSVHETHWNDGEVSSSDRYWILKCGGCDSIYFGHGSTFSEDVEYELNRATGRWEMYNPEFRTFYPRTLKRMKPTWFDTQFHVANHDLSQILNEVYTALNNEIPVIATIGIRTVFDIVSEILGAQPSVSFADKLEYLRKNQHITGRDKDFLGFLVDASSAAAHRGWRPSDEEVTTLIEILEGLIHRAIVLPNRIAKSKKSVPPKM